VTPNGSRNAPAADTRRILVWWYGLVAVAGFGFGLLGERRPFGTDMLAHPLVVFYAGVAVSLIIIRVALGRPVPEVIPERALVAGCIIGAAAYLAANFLVARLASG
jgi:predicted cobalt transporter CbtA